MKIKRLLVSQTDRLYVVAIEGVAMIKDLSEYQDYIHNDNLICSVTG